MAYVRVDANNIVIEIVDSLTDDDGNSLFHPDVEIQFLPAKASVKEHEVFDPVAQTSSPYIPPAPPARPTPSEREEERVLDFLSKRDTKVMAEVIAKRDGVPVDDILAEFETEFRKQWTPTP